MADKPIVKVKRKARRKSRKKGGTPRTKTGKFAPRPELKKKAEDYRDHVANLRKQLMDNVSPRVLKKVVKQLIADCADDDPNIRQSAMRLLFDRALGKAPVYIESKEEKTTRFVKEIILTTPELATPPGYVDVESTVIEPPTRRLKS